MTRQEQEDQAQLEWLRKWKERRKEKWNYKGLRGRHKNKNGDVRKSNKGKCMS